MPITFMFLVILVLLIFFASKRLAEKGIQHLDQAQKAGLIDLFTPLRTKYPAFIITLLVAFFVTLYFNLIPDGVALSIYFFILMFFMLYLAYLSYKILIDNEYPKEYVKSFIQSTVLRITALVLLIVALTSF